MICGVLLHASTVNAAAATNKDAVAVIIGNKNYAGSVPDVDFAHNDAEAMKRFVFDVMGFREKATSYLSKSCHLDVNPFCFHIGSV